MIGQRWRELRDDELLSQDECARRAGIRRISWQAYEAGRHLPSLAALIAISKAFNVSTDWLLGLVPDE